MSRTYRKWYSGSRKNSKHVRSNIERGFARPRAVYERNRKTNEYYAVQKTYNDLIYRGVASTKAEEIALSHSHGGIPHTEWLSLYENTLFINTIELAQFTDGTDLLDPTNPDLDVYLAAKVRGMLGYTNIIILANSDECWIQYKDIISNLHYDDEVKSITYHKTQENNPINPIFRDIFIDWVDRGMPNPKENHWPRFRRIPPYNYMVKKWRFSYEKSETLYVGDEDD